MNTNCKKIIELLYSKETEKIHPILFQEIAERIDKSILAMKEDVSKKILVREMNPDAVKANAEKQKADAEQELLHVDPMMAKEFFLFDVEYKGHVITVKSLGTGLGKPLVSYIDSEKFEIFTDKDIAVRECKSAIDTMIRKKLTSVHDIRKTPERIKKEQEERAREEKMKMQQSDNDK
jgi:hypothetical protein